MLKKLTVSFLIVFVGASLVLASGFSIYEHGAKATAMSGAFIAQANDATAIFYNPAGITGLQGLNLGLGITVIQPYFAFEGPSGEQQQYTKAKKQVFPPPHLYLTYQITDKLAAGFGFYVPYGLGSDWGNEWVGRDLATNSAVQNMALNPVLAYKVLDNLSIAAGFSYVLSTVTLEKSVYLGYVVDRYAEFKLEGESSGMGFNFGLQYKPIEKMNLGIVYKSNVTVTYDDGEATFEIPSVNPTMDAYLQQNLPNTTGKSELVLPTQFGVGLSYDFSEQLTAEFDWLRIGWTSYDQLTLEFEDPVNGATKQVINKNYQTSSSYRLGMEYRMNSALALRAGYMRDMHAVPDENVEPTLPEGDRNLYNLGIGYKFGNITLDAYYTYLTQDEREITNSKIETTVYMADGTSHVETESFNGKYTGMSHLYGVTLGFSF